jgi:hypothetical protein
MFHKMPLNNICFCILENDKIFQYKWNTIDIAYDDAFITTERIDALQFTNAYSSDRFYAIYAQQRKSSKLVDFAGIAAGVSRDVYLLAIIFCCLLVGIFALIEHTRPFHSEFHFWHVTTSVLPCFSCQEPALEHANSPARCVAIIVASIFAFMCTTYYQTLLLSIHEVSVAFALRIREQWRSLGNLWYYSAF